MMMTMMTNTNLLLGQRRAGLLLRPVVRTAGNDAGDDGDEDDDDDDDDDDGDDYDGDDGDDFDYDDN
eukprot:7413567-Karenia_brevis.AAC.1